MDGWMTPSASASAEARRRRRKREEGEGEVEDERFILNQQRAGARPFDRQSVRFVAVSYVFMST